MTSRIFFALIVSILAFGAPLIALAHAQAIWQPYWGPLLSCTGNYQTGDTPPVQTGVNEGGVKEVCRNICDMLHTFQHIVYFGTTVALFAITPIAIAAGGGLMMLSGGNPERVSQGRQIIFGACIGCVLVLCAYAIVGTLIYFVNLGTQLGEGQNDPSLRIQWGSVICAVDFVPDETADPPSPAPTTP